MPDKDPYDQKELLLRISKGDEKAFRLLYNIYFDRLSAYIFKLSKSEAATEEIVQDVFVRLWKSAAAVRETETPEAYIISIARNRTLDYLRKLAKETNLINVLSEQISQQHQPAEDRLTANELQNLIKQALDKLSREKQLVFDLSRNEGLSHDEIAHRLTISKSTVKNHLSETLKHIRKHIDGRYDPEMLLLLILLKSF